MPRCPSVCLHVLADTPAGLRTAALVRVGLVAVLVCISPLVSDVGHLRVLLDYSHVVFGEMSA